MKGQRKVSIALVLTSLTLLVALVSGTWGSASAAGLVQGNLPFFNPAAFVIPTIQIVSVQADQSVTIRTYNYPANDTFTVLMNVMHTQGIGGIQVGTLDSGAGGSLTATFDIPDQLKGQRQIAIRVESPTSGYFSYNWFWNNTSGIPVSGDDGTIPIFFISSVDPDKTVTVVTTNTFPANQEYDVLMNYMGTLGANGIKVDTFNSGAGGTFAKTFNIPDQLKGQQRIAIRFQSTNSAFFSYNWFWNKTGSSGIPISGGIPTFSITDVVQDDTVSIKTHNFPADQYFDVLMNYIGTRGVNGIKVDTIHSDGGGTLSMSFKIPDALKGQQQIAIRLQGVSSPYFAYNWFWNNTSGGIPVSSGGLPPGVIPTISITGVVRDGTVTVQTHNFPANDHFVVLMNYMHTQGINGTQVDEFDSGTGGSFPKTFNVPDYLKGQRQIAIRIYSPTSRYFAYNWFWNNTTP